MNFRRRRVLPSPNKNKAKVLRRQAAQEQIPLEDLYPTVSRLAIDLSFFDAQGLLFDTSRRDMGVQDVVDLDVPCPGVCGQGSMDLAAKVDDMVSKGEVYSEARGRCAQPAHTADGQLCGCELRCTVTINYR